MIRLFAAGFAAASLLVSAPLIDTSVASEVATRSTRSIAYERVALADSGSAQNIAAITHHVGSWWAAGSFVDETGEHRPGLWTSMGSTWARIQTKPRTPYGEISEIFSVAVSESGTVAALGAATGGAHGNPRTVSWLLTGDGFLTEVPAGFELYNGLRQISVRSISAGPNNWVIFGARVNQNGKVGATSWTSPNADDFTIHDDDPQLSATGNQQTLGLDVVYSPFENAYLAVGEHLSFSNGQANTDGVLWRSFEGVDWSTETSAARTFGGPNDQRLQRIRTVNDETVIAGTETTTRFTTFSIWSKQSGKWRTTPVVTLGRDENPLSQVTSLSVTPGARVLGVRVGERLAAAAKTKQGWVRFPLPKGLPSGNRAVLAVETDGQHVLVGASEPGGSSGNAADSGGGSGGLWTATIPATFRQSP